MYSYQGCYKKDNQFNNFFIDKVYKNSTLGDCNNLANLNNSPYFALTSGGPNKTDCLIGKDISDNIMNLTNNPKISEIYLYNKDLTRVSNENICGYFNKFKKNDVYAGSNNYSLYTNLNSLLMFNNSAILSETYISSFYLKNQLHDLDKEFKNIIKKLKENYIEYIISKSEIQKYNNKIISNNNVDNKLKILENTFKKFIKIHIDYNNLINIIENNSNIVNRKINVFNKSKNYINTNLYTNNNLLTRLLNSGNGQNGMLFDNKYKKYVYLTENLLLISIILLAIYYTIKNKNKNI